PFAAPSPNVQAPPDQGLVVPGADGRHHLWHAAGNLSSCAALLLSAGPPRRSVVAVSFWLRGHVRRRGRPGIRARRLGSLGDRARTASPRLRAARPAGPRDQAVRLPRPAG